MLRSGTTAAARHRSYTNNKFTLEPGNKKVARKYIEGVVVGVGFMDKTVTVAARRPVAVPRTRRIIKHQTKYLVHDPENVCDLGDRVSIAQSKPYSKRKHHIIHQIVRKNAAAAFLAAHPQYVASQVWKEKKETKGRRILLRTYDYLLHEHKRVKTGKQHERVEKFKTTDTEA
jgi:small subunit ribosomal protein S17